MQMPRLLHDYTVEWNDALKGLFEDVEAGRLSVAQAYDYFRDGEGRPLQSIWVMWRMLLGYRFYGQQTFVVGPRLREMLENTSLVGVPWDAVRWPYPFFYVALPECPSLLWGGATGWHNVSGVLVGISAEGDMSFYLWGDENERARTRGDDASFWFTVPAGAVSRTGTDMETYLDSMMRDPRSNWADGSLDDLVSAQAEVMRTGSADDRTIAVARGVLRVVVNLCVYLQSTGAEATPHPKYEAVREARRRLEDEVGRKKSPGKRKHLQRDLDKLSKAHVTWLGRTIEEAPPRSSGSGAGGGASMFWVRGHWWPRLDNREASVRHKTRWVQPYQKNKDEDEASPRRYRIAGDDGGSR
jgi:hypothetical protein